MRKFFIIFLMVLMVCAFAIPAQARCCVDGVDGADGIDGVKGDDGIDGSAGKNAYVDNEYGLGVDVVLYEKGDTFGNLGNVKWLDSIYIDYKCDLSDSKARHQGYIVTRVKIGKSAIVE